MSRKIQYQKDNGSWKDTNLTNPFTIDELNNGQEYSIKIKVFDNNEEAESLDSDAVTATPQEVSEILVDDYINDMNNPSDVRQGIIDGNTAANNQNATLVFSGTTYEYSSQIVVPNAKWKGVFGFTQLKRVGSYSSGNGIQFTHGSNVEDISLDFNKLNNNGVRWSGTGSVHYYKRGEVQGCRQATTTSGTVRALDVRGEVGELYIEEAIVHGHDSLAERNNSNHQTPQVRGLLIDNSGTTSSQYVEVKNCTFYDIRSNTNQSNWGVGGVDVDSILIDQSRGLSGSNNKGNNRVTKIIGCHFEETEKRFIKANQPDEVYIEDCTFKINQGQGTLINIDIQEPCDGHVIDCTLTYERMSDVSFRNNLFVFIGGETGITSNNPFGTLEIKRNTVHVLQGNTSNVASFAHCETMGIDLIIEDNGIILDSGTFRNFLVIRGHGKSTSGSSQSIQISVLNNDLSEAEISHHSLVVNNPRSNGVEDYFEITHLNNTYHSNNSINDGTLPNGWGGSIVSIGSTFNGVAKT